MYKKKLNKSFSPVELIIENIKINPARKIFIVISTIGFLLYLFFLINIPGLFTFLLSFTWLLPIYFLIKKKNLGFYIFSLISGLQFFAMFINLFLPFAELVEYGITTMATSFIITTYAFFIILKIQKEKRI